MIRLIKLYMNWCSPCMALSRVLPDFENDYEIEEIEMSDRLFQMEMIQKYNLINVPTLLFEKDGEIVDRLDWDISKEQIEEVLVKIA